MKTCPRCGRSADDAAQFCSGCGYSFATQQQNPQQPYQQPYQPVSADNAFDPCGPEGKSRGIAALLAILLGGLGIQYFYCGKTTAGILTILLTLVTCGLWEILMVVQGVLMLCMTNAQFRQKYILSTATLPLF